MRLAVAGMALSSSSGRERAIQAHLQHADLLAVGGQVLDGLLRRFGAGAHQDHHAFGVRRADVFIQLVLAPGQLGELVHRLLHDAGHGARNRG